MPYRAAWIAAQKPMFRLESYNSGIGMGVDSNDASQTLVDPIHSAQAQADESKAPPRPPNAWILYRTAKLTEFKAQCPSGNIEWKDLQSTSSDSAKDEASPPLVRSRNTCLQAQLSRLISNMWKMETAEVKAEYYAKADERKRMHTTMFPDYTYRPKKKRTAHHSRKEGEEMAGSSASAPLLSPSQLSPPMSSTATRRRKRLSKAKSLYSIRSKLVSPRTDVAHRPRSASPYPTPLLSPTVDTLPHSYDSSPRSLVHGLLPTTPLTEAEVMQRRTLARHSCGDAMLPTYMTPSLVDRQQQEHQHHHHLLLLQQQQRLHESTLGPDTSPHNPSFDTATESGEEAQLSPTLVITPPAPPSVFAANHFHSATSLTTSQDNIVPWTAVYQAGVAINDPSQQHWRTHAIPPQSGSPQYHATPDGTMHPFYQQQPDASTTDYFQAAQLKNTSTQASVLEQSKMPSSFNNNNSMHSITTRNHSDGAISPNSLRFTSSIMARQVPTDVQYVPIPLAMPLYAGAGAAGPPFAGGTTTPSVLGYTSHAMQYSNSSPVRTPLLSPGFATNALQLQFADLQMQHQQSPQAHASLIPRS